ncbi:MAG: universal stress protein [Acidimicrobiia bacterium]|nr:universal stress protein [Acidimicrobiia bacterium]
MPITGDRPGENGMNEIVVGVDETETAGRAAATAAELAADMGVPLHMVMCVSGSPEDVTVGGERVHLDPVERARNFLGSLRFERNPPETSTFVSVAAPAEVICAEAERLDAQIIVVGNRRVQGLARVLGSVGVDVLRRAHCDVLIAHTTG